MMRGCAPLFVTVAALTALSAPAHAQSADDDDDDEPGPPAIQPLPPPIEQQQPQQRPMYPMPIAPQPLATPLPTVNCCCCRSDPPPRKLLLELSIGPIYRRALGEDWAAVAPELEIGGQDRNFSAGVRFSVALGGTRVGLPYQNFVFGPAFMFRLSPRWRFGFGATFGVLMYERASATAASDPVVYTGTLGATLDLTVDLLRTRSGGAIYLGARGGCDWIAVLHPEGLDDASLTAGVSVGWRL